MPLPAANEKEGNELGTLRVWRPADPGRRTASPCTPCSIVTFSQKSVGGFIKGGSEVVVRGTATHHHLATEMGIGKLVA